MYLRHIRPNICTYLSFFEVLIQFVAPVICRTVGRLSTRTASSSSQSNKMQIVGIVFMQVVGTSSAFAIVSRRMANVPSSSCCSSTPPRGNNDDDEIFYNDFDSPIGGSGLSDSDQTTFPGSSALLQERLNQLVATEQESQIRVSENWKQGHWSVRGCSLDRGDPEFGDKGVQISSIVPLEDETILVGRTDGSICWLKVGSEYMATFTNRLTAQHGANDTISIGNELQRDELASIPMPRDDPASPRSATGDASKFEILSQLQTSSGKIVDMAVAVDQSQLFVLSDSLTAPLQLFSIREDGPASMEGFNLPVSLETNKIVAVQTVRDTNVLSMSESGAVSRWSVNSLGSCSILSSFQISLEDDDSVLCCDADDDFVYLGTAGGSVFIYSVDHILLKSDSGVPPQPLKVFSSFSNAGVSSICAAGDGVMGQGRSTPTLALITGSTDGDIKQWELLPRGTGAVEYWPKLSSQTLPGKAHILKGTTEKSPILDLRKVQDGIVLSATQGQLVIWDSATGEAMSTMPGLNFEQGASCLVLSRSLLVTNGMCQYVCVHDFSIDPNLQMKDMLAPMDDEDE
jgi:hypothetical protein